MLTMLNRHHRLGTAGQRGDSPREHELGEVPPVSPSFMAPEARAFQGPLDRSAKRLHENGLLRWWRRRIATRRFVRNLNHRGHEEPGGPHRVVRSESSLPASESSIDFPRVLRVPLPCSPWFNHRCSKVNQSSRITPRHRADLAPTRTRNLPCL